MRDKLAGYLNKLIGYGVSGFRVDAAKHIGAGRPGPRSTRRLHKTKDGDKPYWALEVFRGGPGSLSPQALHHASASCSASTTRVRSTNAFKSYTAPNTSATSPP